MWRQLGWPFSPPSTRLTVHNSAFYEKDNEIKKNRNFLKLGLESGHQEWNADHTIISKNLKVD